MTVFSTEDHQWMSQALRLAAQGLRTTSPNPRVGCLLVRDGQLVGSGWHQRAGEPHAEVYALAAAGERAAGQGFRSRRPGDALRFVLQEPGAGLPDRLGRGRDGNR